MAHTLPNPKCHRCGELFGAGELVVYETALDSHRRLALEMVHERCGRMGVPGPQGPQGPAGPVGPQGEPSTVPGPQGPEGPRGESIVGPQGKQGVPGPVGPMGPRGEQGRVGADGERGPEGPRGERGLQGDQGPVGPMGPPDTTLAERLTRLERFVADPKVFTPRPAPVEDVLAGEIACPDCKRVYNLQADLHIGKAKRARLVCECGASLVVTSDGVGVR